MHLSYSILKIPPPVACRDIKPSNLAITSTKHLQLLDFGCAAPLSLSQSPNSSNSPPRRILPYDDCLVPCGTCDYLSPEVLIWHETALARARNANNAGDEESEDDTWAQEWSEDIDMRSKVVDKLRRSVNGHGGNQTAVGDIGSAMGDILEGYGPETDWWSLGAMVYELTYGVAPFFAPDVPTTYQRVLSHKVSFDVLFSILKYFLERKGWMGLYVIKGLIDVGKENVL